MNVVTSSIPQDISFTEMQDMHELGNRATSKRFVPVVVTFACTRVGRNLAVTVWAWVGWLGEVLAPTGRGWSLASL